MSEKKSYATYSAIALTCAIAMTASGQTREFLDAPVVNSAIPVRWDATGKALQWLDRKADPTQFGSNDLFVSKGAISVTYPMMNPLLVRGSASAAAVADPSVAIIGKLFDALSTVVTTVAPPPPAAAAAFSMQNTNPMQEIPLAPCEATGSVAQNLSRLWQQMYGPDAGPKPTEQVQRWIKGIDDGLKLGPGFEAVQNAADQIGRDAEGVGNRIAAIKGTLDRIHTCAQSGNSTDLGVYLDADLSQGHNNTMLQQLTALKNTMTQLQTELHQTFADRARWVGPERKDFRMNTADILPTLEKMQNVTVKLVSFNADVDPSTGALKIGTPDAITVTFRLRRYSFLTPEIGAGAVFGTITKPNYGTDKNAAGQTVVAKTANSSLSISPSLMVNFVCHCSAGPLAPMAQIGTSVSKDLPGILLGGGLRLFGLGKGDISLSGGAMFAWVKDLQKLKPGDVVNGTADINADLGYTSKPKTGKYFAILYKF